MTIPTRWVSQMEGQLADAERRITAARRQLEAGNGGRALEETYPGVMGTALVRVWLADEPWHRPRSAAELSQMVEAQLPSGFATLFEMKKMSQTGFAGWRAEDARPFIDEAAAFVAAVRADFTQRRASS